MFSSPRTNIIESDSGFSVEVLGRVGVRYREHGKSMTIDSEVLAGPSALVLYTDSITQWDSPHDFELVDDKTRRRIVDNVCEAFLSRGLKISLQ